MDANRRRLSPLDASFLYLESETTPMHIASLTVYEDGPAPVEDLLENLERRLHLVPRFRQKLGFVPFNQHRPAWVDDTGFDLRSHVHHIALPAPGSDAQLKELCGELLSLPLPRTKPLWEMWVIDGLEGGLFALLTKTHHSLWDGLEGADLHAVLLDTTPEPKQVDPEPWSPCAMDRRELLADAVRERFSFAAGTVGNAMRALREPRRLLQTGADVLGSAAALLRAGARPAPDCPLNSSIGCGRRYEIAEVPLGVVRSIRQGLGGTVNDVVLAAVGGALGDWLRERDLEIPELRAMVPMSTRRPEQRGGLGNQVGLLLVPIPTSDPDPVRRLEWARISSERAKSSRMAAGAELFASLGGVAPPSVLARLQKAQTVHRFFNVLVTNMRGPQEPLYLAGRRMVGLFPQAPLATNQALSVAVMSYQDRLHFGLLADRDRVPDLSLIAQGIEESMTQMWSAATGEPVAGARAAQPPDPAWTKPGTAA